MERVPLSIQPLIHAYRQAVEPLQVSKKTGWDAEVLPLTPSAKVLLGIVLLRLQTNTRRLLPRF